MRASSWKSFEEQAPELAEKAREPFETSGGGLVGFFDDMTTDDYNQVMKGVGIADLKAHLSKHLRKVQRGHTLTVLDRDRPVARIVPYDAEAPLEVRRATRSPRDLRLPPPPSKPTDSLTLLLEDRGKR